MQKFLDLRTSSILRALAWGVILYSTLNFFILEAVLGLDGDIAFILRVASIMAILVGGGVLWLLHRGYISMAGNLLIFAMPFLILSTAPISKWGQPFILLPLASPIVFSALVSSSGMPFLVAGFIIVLLGGADQFSESFFIDPSTLSSYVAMALISALIGRAIRTYVAEIEEKTVAFETANGELIRRSDQLQQANRELAQKSAELQATNQILSQQSDQLRTAMNEMTEATKSRDMMMAAISHDLRSPIATIIGYLDLLEFRMEEHLDGDAQRSLQIIRSNGEYALTLMDDILSTARLQAGKLILEPIPIYAVEVLEQMLAEHYHSAESKGLDLTLKVEDPKVVLYADMMRFTQVMRNLISNAIKYTKTGSICITLARGDENMALIKVTDTGEGIPEESLTTIFDPFSQTERSRRRRDSTGLGLSIVKRLTEAHNGRVTVESTLDAGTTFTLIWPCVQSPNTSAAEMYSLV